MFAPGRHSVRVVHHALGRSSKGTPRVTVQFEDVNGERIVWDGYLSDAALERTLASLQILGWDPVANDGRVDSLNGTGILVDNEAEIVVEHEVYNEDIQAKVKWVNAPGGGTGEAMADDDAKSFAAQLRAKILSAPRPKASTQPGPAKAAVPAAAGAGARRSAADDDLPF
jgi:hypothetical protein